MDKKVLHKISYGLFAVTAKDGEKDNGCIINTFMQISSDPLTGVIAVNKANYTHDMIMKTQVCNISLLNEDTKMSLIEHFGFQTGKETNKFEEFKEIERSSNGVLYITKSSNGFISGKVLETFEFGTHTMFKLKLEDGQVLAEEKPLTYEFYQTNIKPKPTVGKKVGWVCNICGYVYEGDPLPSDFVCPLCKHGAEDFSKL